MGEEQENIELRINNVIRNVRKDRNRAGFENILTKLNRDEPNLEMDKLKEIIISMTGKGSIIDKGKGDSNSFYIVEESSDSTTTVEGTNKKNYGDDDTLQNLQMFIDDKLHELIINKIKLEVKNALSQELNILHQSNELKVINVPQSIDSNKDDSVNIPQRIDYTNDAFVKSLHDEISFLRKEVESKDTIIKILLNERSTTVNATVNTDNTTDLRLNKNKNNAKSNVLDDNVDENNISDEAKENKFTEVTRKKKGQRNITLLGDSIIKNIEGHRMKRCMRRGEKIYVKSFPGAKTADMKDYVRPSQRYNPELFLLHTGCNDLISAKTPDEISDEIVRLALDLKNDENDVIISGIIARNDELNEKGKKVNDLLKIKCNSNDLGFMDHSNILAHKHLNGSGIHLNFNGTITLADNFLKVINI